jgi:hypothetical protein
VLAGFQDAFVALAADARLRRQLAADPDHALDGFALDDRERAVLREISLGALDRYARSLIAKRWGELARVLRWTSRVAPGLGGRYRAWALEHPAAARDDVLAPGVAEALRVPLRELIDDASPPYAIELATFEALRAASRGDGKVRAMRGEFAIHAIAEEIARGLLPIDPDREPTELRFDRTHVQWRRA